MQKALMKIAKISRFEKILPAFFAAKVDPIVSQRSKTLGDPRLTLE